MPDAPRLTILLCTHNGARHLPDQLESYLAQDYPGWDLWVSDDGSTDDTVALVRDFAARVGGAHAVRLLAGPRQGAARNFLSLLGRDDLPAGPVALSDQDDVWLPDKLSRAVAGLRAAPGVALYGAQSRYVDAALHSLGATTTPPPRPPTFGNTLTQTAVSGHTACLSAAAVALVRASGAARAEVPFHDWWLSQVIAGAGGSIVIDPAIVALYRQHGANVLGAHDGLRGAVLRLGLVLRGDYGRWIAANRRALDSLRPSLTPAARAALDALARMPEGPGLGRWRGYRAAGVGRQGRIGAGVFQAAAVAGLV